MSARYIQPELFDCVLRYLEEAGRIALDGAVVRATSHGIRFTPEQEMLKAAMEARLNTEDFANLPTLAELAQALDAPRPQVTDMVQALQAWGGSRWWGLLICEALTARRRCETFKRAARLRGRLRTLMGSNANARCAFSYFAPD